MTQSVLLVLLPVAWFGIGTALGVPCGIAIAWTVWRLSRGRIARWMDLREDPK